MPIDQRGTPHNRVAASQSAATPVSAPTPQKATKASETRNQAAKKALSASADQPRCTISGCRAQARAHGWCYSHYQRWRRYGDPTYTPPPPPTRQCSIDGCTRPHCARGWCRPHYMRWHQFGDVHHDPSDWRPRFWAKVDRGSDVDCWLWIGSLQIGGYGRYLLPNGETRLAHRLLWELTHGPIPEGLQIDHLCRVRACVNPNHLEVVTQQENMRRGIGYAAQNSRKTHCKRGHEFTPANTRVGRKGERNCRACHRQHARAFKAARRARTTGGTP